MNKWKNSMVIATIAMGLALPSFAQAAEPGLPDTEMTPASRMAHDHGEHGQMHKKMRHGMHGSVHQKMYMLLLAEKYTPDSVAQWQEVFKERERLMSEFAALREDPKWKAKREECRQLVSKLNEQVKKAKSPTSKWSSSSPSGRRKTWRCRARRKIATPGKPGWKNAHDARSLSRRD